MSFLNNLAKGFVRSAVNQVGRDGGKVISNSLYNNKHSTPIKTTFQQSNINSVENNEDRETLKNKGYKPKKLSYNWFVYCLIFLVTLIIPYIGPLFWIYKSIKNLLNKKTKFYRYEDIPVYKTDRRYKSGTRHIGYKKVKQEYENSIDATKNERKLNIAKGIIAGIISFILLAFNLSMYKSSQNDTNKQEITFEKAIINAIEDLNVRESYSKNSKVINVVHHNDEVHILALKDSLKALDKTWALIQFNENKKGWVWGKFLTKE